MYDILKHTATRDFRRQDAKERAIAACTPLAGEQELVDIVRCMDMLEQYAEVILHAIRTAPPETIVVVRVGAESVAAHAVARRWAHRVACADDESLIHIRPNPHATQPSLIAALRAWANEERARARIHVRVKGETTRITVELPPAGVNISAPTDQPDVSPPAPATARHVTDDRNARARSGAVKALLARLRRGRHTPTAGSRLTRATPDPRRAATVVVAITQLADGERAVAVTIDGQPAIMVYDAPALVRALVAVRSARRGQQSVAGATYARQLDQAARALHSAVLLLTAERERVRGNVGDSTHVA